MSKFSYIEEYIEDGTTYTTYCGKYRISTRWQGVGTAVDIYDTEFDRVELRGHKEKENYFIDSKLVPKQTFYDKIKAYFL